MTLKKSFTKTTNFMMMMFAIYWTLHTRVGARALSLYKNSTTKPL